MTITEEKAKALAEFLKVSKEELTEGVCYDNSICYDNQEYLVLTDDEADQRAKEEILESLWAFNADFIIDHCKNVNNMSTWEYQAAIESLRKAQADQCENLNGLVFALIDDIDEFVDDAITSDGRGHFISRYDGEENEEGDFFIYRVD